jgi:hypothetical protein
MPLLLLPREPTLQRGAYLALLEAAEQYRYVHGPILTPGIVNSWAGQGLENSPLRKPPWLSQG